jgi:hypothetical protein
MHVLQSKKARYSIALFLSALIYFGISFATYSDTFEYTCKDGRTGCASQKSFGWPMPFTNRSVNGTLPPQYQREEATTLDPVGTAANIVIIVITALGIERVLRLTLKK